MGKEEEEEEEEEEKKGEEEEEDHDPPSRFNHEIPKGQNATSCKASLCH